MEDGNKVHVVNKKNPFIKEILSESFVRFYEEIYNLLPLLTTIGISIATRIALMMDDENYVEFDTKTEYKFFGFDSKEECDKYIDELIKHKFISRGRIENSFWVNMLYVCRIERVSLLEKYIKKP